MRTLWSNSRERMEDYEKRQGREIISQRLRNLPERDNRLDAEDVNNPKIAPQDHDIRQSERVLEFQNEIFGQDQQICLGIIPFL